MFNHFPDVTTDRIQGNSLKLHGEVQTGYQEEFLHGGG